MKKQLQSPSVMIGGTCQAVWCWHRLSPDSRPVTHIKVRKEAIQLMVPVLFAAAVHREALVASKNFVQMCRRSLSSGSPGLGLQSPQSTINSVFLILIRDVEALLSSFDEKRSYSGRQMCSIMSKAFKGLAADFVLDFKLNNFKKLF